MGARTTSPNEQGEPDELYAALVRMGLMERGQRPQLTSLTGGGVCNAALIKPKQARTITETKAAFDAAKVAGWATIVSARSGESEDLTIVHLAIGWDAGQLKVGSITRSERTAKWNEAIRIEDVLGVAARFAGRSVLPTRR